MGRRVNIQPSKLVMGYGFYGRSFQLANPSCTTPGCPFTGSALPGPCSSTAGILMYYEIMALLKQNPSLQSVWDHDAAVKYLIYGDGKQWISYDDVDTFSQKRKFQDQIGLGGLMIWASDAGKSSIFPFHVQ
jgi:chitinase